jgi:hypothetical protein
MPTHHDCQLHDHQSAAPLQRLRQHGQADSGRGIYPPRPDTPLHEQCQLTTEEETFDVDRLARAQQQRHPPQGFFNQTACYLGEGDHALMLP